MSNKLYIGNLAFSATEDKIHQVFGTVGPVESVKIIMDRDSGRSRGFGFVEMESQDGAARAIEELNGEEIDGRAIRVSEATEKEPRSSRPRY